MSDSTLESILVSVDTLLDIQKTVLAERELKAAVDQAPDEERVLERLARLRYLQQRYTEGVEAARRVIAKNPSSVNGRFFLACCLEFTGEVEQAVDVWKRLLAESPQSANYHAFLAEVYFWHRELRVSPDETAVHLDAALKLDPVNETAKHLEFWIALRANDETRMRDVIAFFQNTNPDGRTSARLLSRFIRDYKREDSATIPALLRMFPDDPELLRLAKEQHDTREWFDLVREKLFEIFPENASAEDLRRPLLYLRKFADEGASFSLRKVARLLADMKEADHAPLAALIMDLTSKDGKTRLRLLPVLEWLLEKTPAAELDRLVRKAFALDYNELYLDFFKRFQVRPSEATWEFIWPKVAARPQLLDEVLKRYGAYQPRPPVSIDMMIDRAGQLRPPMIVVAQHLLRDDPAVVAPLWRMFQDRSLGFSDDDREKLLSLVANGPLELWVRTPGVVPDLIRFLAEKKNRGLRSFATLWATLSYVPEGRLKTMSEAPGYRELLRAIAATLLDPSFRQMPDQLALFLVRAPWLPEDLAPVKDELEKLKEDTTDSDLRQRLTEILQRFPAKPTPADVARDIAREQRETLQAEQKELDAQKREIARQQVELQQMKVQLQTQGIAAIQAKFQAKAVEIQNSNSEPLAKAAALQSAAAEMQAEMEKLLKS